MINVYKLSWIYRNDASSMRSKTYETKQQAVKRGNVLKEEDDVSHVWLDVMEFTIDKILIKPQQCEKVKIEEIAGVEDRIKPTGGYIHDKFKAEAQL